MKFYGSSSGFLWGQTAVTKYDSACLRSIVFKMLNSDIRTDIEQKYMDVGEHHETWLAVELGKTERFQLWEIPSRGDIIDGVQYTGRADFILPDCIYETKASLSKHAMNYVVRKGQVSPNYLAQLGSYFWRFDREHGAVSFGAYKQTEGGFQQLGNRMFDVVVAEDGRLLIDGKDSPYFMQDLLAHITTAADRLSRRKVHESRPLNWDQKFSSPCTYCTFSAVCDSYDGGDIDDERAISMARETLLRGKNEDQS